MRIPFLAFSLLLLAQPAFLQGSVTTQGLGGQPLATPSPARHPARTWFATYGGPGSELPWSTVQTRNQSFQVAGQTFSTDAVMGDGWVLQLSPAGAVRWQLGIGGAGADEFRASLATPDGGTLLAGTTSSSGAGGTDGWLVKLGPTGAIQWQQTYGGPEDEQFTALAAAPSGFYIGGSVRRSETDVDAWLLAVDASGAVSWQQALGGERDDQLMSIAVTPDGLAFTANSSSTFGKGVVAFFRPWLVKLDHAGSVLWEKTYDISSGDGWSHLIALEEGGFVATGEALAMAFFRGDMWVVRLSETGDIVWDRRLGDNFGTNWVDSGAQVQRTSDGGFLVAGMTGTANPFEDIWLVKLSSEGAHEWGRVLGGAATEYGHTLIPAQGGHVVAGFRPGIGEALVMRVTAGGRIASGCGQMGPSAPNIWTSALTLGAPSATPEVTSVAPVGSSATGTAMKDTGAYVCSPP